MRFSFESKGFLLKPTLHVGGRLLDLSTPHVMGILNVTPDSFYDGNVYHDEASILVRAGRMLEEGATFIDIGGYSSRPGAADVSPEDEISRVLRAVRPIRREFPEAIISVDTFRAQVARVACAEGADIVNDVSGGALDAEMHMAVAEMRVPYILMHMRGTPATMTSFSVYSDLMTEVAAELQKRISIIRSAGVEQLIIDPGFGFAKTITQNFKLMDSLSYLTAVFDLPILVGVSRKSMIWKTLKITAGEALNGTTAMNTIALLHGASILRVHDVKEAVQTVELLKNLKHNRP